MVFLVVILIPGLHIVVALTKRLPVGFIPEKPCIPAMRCDMVHNRCLHIPAFCHTPHAQWMRFQEPLAGLLPFTTISTAGRRTRFLRMERLVPGAVFRSIWHQLRTARMRTGPIWPKRHFSRLVSADGFQMPSSIPLRKKPPHSPCRYTL